MIEAQFYFNNVLVSKRMIDRPCPPETIRECAYAPLEAISTWGESIGPERGPRLHYWVYTRKERTGPNSVRYDFNGEESDVKFAKTEGRVWDVGFPDTEPDENINLKKLTDKFRNSAPVKELLVKYYNRK